MMRSERDAPAIKGVIPGTVPVPTPPFSLVQRFIEQVVALSGLLLVTGPGGTGKTYAVHYACDRLEVPAVRLHLAGTTRAGGVLREILGTFELPADGTEAILRERVRHFLAGRRFVLYVDEANLLTTEALRLLRYLHDQPDAAFALVFTGTDFRRAFAGVPEFDSRVKRRVAFGPLAGAELIRALAATHPVFAASDPEILRSIDRQYARGLWRQWATVLEYALVAGATPEGGIGIAMARGILGGTAPAGTSPRGKRRAA